MMASVQVNLLLLLLPLEVPASETKWSRHFLGIHSHPDHLLPEASTFGAGRCGIVLEGRVASGWPDLKA